MLIPILINSNSKQILNNGFIYCKKIVCGLNKEYKMFDMQQQNTESIIDEEIQQMTVSKSLPMESQTDEVFSSVNNSPVKNKLNNLLTKAERLNKHYQAKAAGQLQSFKHTNGNTKNLSRESFVPPSPIFSFINRYPVLAGYSNQLLYWDTRLCIRINRFSYDEHIASFFKVVSRLGDGWFWYAMLAVAALMGGMAQLHLVVATIITSLMGVGLYKLLKVKTVRPRPYQVHQVIILGERPLDVFSFPSGHTLQAVLFTVTLGMFFPALLPIMIPFAFLVAISRMVLGLHYPTDVLIGAALGIILSQLAPHIANMLLMLIA